MQYSYEYFTNLIQDYPFIANIYTMLKSVASYRVCEFTVTLYSLSSLRVRSSVPLNTTEVQGMVYYLLKFQAFKKDRTPFHNQSTK